MNKFPLFSLFPPAKISAAFEPFAAQSAAGGETFKGPATLEDLKDYMVDAGERGLLLLDILRGTAATNRRTWPRGRSRPF